MIYLKLFLKNETDSWPTQVVKKQKKQKNFRLG